MSDNPEGKIHRAANSLVLACSAACQLLSHEGMEVDSPKITLRAVPRSQTHEKAGNSTWPEAPGERVKL